MKLYRGFLTVGGMTVTSSPNKGLEVSLAVVERLRALGLEVVIHLAARMLRDREPVRPRGEQPYRAGCTRGRAVPLFQAR